MASARGNNRSSSNNNMIIMYIFPIHNISVLDQYNGKHELAAMTAMYQL
jgi:hypothetical protein